MRNRLTTIGTSIAMILLLIGLSFTSSCVANPSIIQNSYLYHDRSVQYEPVYDLLIITPKIFASQLEPLVDHKNDIGITTNLITLDTIYSEISGRDQAEQVKYYIKYAIEEWGIKYVLLVGGMRHQGPGWHTPVRYVAMDDGWEAHYLSDLYFADIYDAEGNFSTWDTDNDSVFGEWPYQEIAQDQDIDLIPDIAVGRLPVRNSIEVLIMVQKIIQYERTTFGQSWFNDIVLIAGDDTGIETLIDLKGKNINIGNLGSGSRGNAIDAMLSCGIEWRRELSAEGIRAADSANLLQSGRIDAFFYTVGHPNESIKEATAGKRKVHFVPLTGDCIDQLVAKWLYYAKAYIPISFYPMARNKQ